jgi:predicted Zn finger-like uncharacterized protein
MFRVVPDQLRISEGWVRCGQCDEVFDANAHLKDLAQLAVTQQSQPAMDADAVAHTSYASDEAQVAVQTSQAPATENSEQAYDWGPMLVQTASLPLPPIEFGDAPDSLGAAAVPSPDTADASVPTDLQVPGEREDAFLAQNPHDLPLAEESLATQLANAQVDGWLHDAPTPQALDQGWAGDAPAPGSAPVPLSFMPRGEAPARRWLGRNVLLALCLVFVALLALQGGLSQRNQLAASVPTLRPVLLSACELLGCVISAPRQIESIAIESSAFTNVKPGLYLLSLSLKNAAAMELEAPALELSLTDLQDQVLLRRVITPGEFATSQSIAASAELSANLPLSLKMDARSNSISGYKLLAFYP